ncbi:MAG: MlaA family lipoprotein [Caulobacteraceae bacterium]
MTALAAASAIPAFAGEPPPPPRAVNPAVLQPSDPLEKMNRVFFAVDKGVNRLLGGRTSVSSAKILPKPARTALYNFFNNLDEPSTIANEALQGDWRHAAIAGGRFVTNTTVGVAGTIDVASRIGLRRHLEDFGQTMARWGITPGPYLYMPLAGPSTIRDRLGDKVDGLANPLHWVELDTVAKKALGVTRHVVQPHTISIRERARMAVEAGETDDEYAYLRDLYFAQRAAEIQDVPTADQYRLPAAPEPPPGVHEITQADAPADMALRQPASPDDAATAAEQAEMDSGGY